MSETKWTPEMVKYLIDESLRTIQMLSTMLREDYRPKYGYDGSYGTQTQRAVEEICTQLMKWQDARKAEKEGSK